MCYWLFIFYGSIYEYVQPVTRTNFLVQILWVLESWKCAVSIKKKKKKKHMPKPDVKAGYNFIPFRSLRSKKSV